MMSYTDTMYITDPKCKTYFKIAQPEALSMNPQKGQIVLRLSDNGRPLFKEIEGDGSGFAEQFAEYSRLFYNYRFGETTEAVLQAILRQHRAMDGVDVSGETIFKSFYEEKHRALLNELTEKKKTAMNKPSELRLYTVLFKIVREKFNTVHNFIK